jgi:aryl-alcohol dehydrogenase-like predicted oxidoreductase
VSSVIVGANKMAQLEDNLKAADVELTVAEVERLSSTTQPATLYPQWMVERQNSRWR